MPAKRGQASLRFLVFGDIVGKIGRRAVAAVLPSLRKRYRPDLVIANAENLAHGLGVTESSLNEMKTAGVDVFTSGNNVWSKDGSRLLESEPQFIRPANYPARTPGRGWLTVSVRKQPVLIINLQGRVHMNQQVDDPLTTFDRILAEQNKHTRTVLVDFHAEVTSEKAALAWYADGRASAVLGTHTHVQTADARVLPKGTAFLSDIGMCGALDSVIGTDVAAVLQHQLTQMPLKHIIPETGPATVNAVLVEVNARTGTANRILPLSETVSIPAPSGRRKGVST